MMLKSGNRPLIVGNYKRAMLMKQLEIFPRPQIGSNDAMRTSNVMLNIRLGNKAL